VGEPDAASLRASRIDYRNCHAPIHCQCDTEINFMLHALGNPGPVATICVNEGQSSLAPGVTAAGSNIILAAGGFTIIVKATTTTLEGSATQDSDGDGVPDHQDNFPGDPTRS